MEDSKYYTPSIEEFYVGFQYEMYDKDHWSDEGKWVTHIFDTHHSLSNIEYQLTTYKKEWFRVKYLDKSDIESCGFTTRLELNSSGQGYSKDNSFLFVKDLQIPLFLHHQELNKLFIIHRSCDARSIIHLSRARFIGIDNGVIIPEIQLFNGYINNLSTLRKLLKQLGIE